MNGTQDSAAAQPSGSAEQSAGTNTNTKRAVIGRLAAWCVWAAAIVIGFMAPLWYWRGGLVELETLHFIRSYLADRSLLSIIFDPEVNDFGCYQARELSYLVDYIDARVFASLLGRGILLFTPMSAWLATLLTTVVYLVSVRRLTRLPALLTGFLLLLYFSNFVFISTAGMHYRSTKPLLAPVLMAAIFYVWHLLSRETGDTRAGRRGPALVFALFLLMGLLDRQGFFYAAMGCGLLVMNAVIWRGRRDLAWSAGAAVGSLMLYNLVLAPMTIELANGYRPSFHYQRLPVAELFSNPLRWLHGGKLVLEANSLLMGGIPYLASAVILAGLLVVLWRGGHGKTAIVMLLALAGQAAMLAMMIVRHPYVYEWVDHRLWYYPLPFQLMLLAGVTIVISVSLAGWSRWRRGLLYLLLAAAIGGNLVRWDTYRDGMLQSHWFPRIYIQSGIIKGSLREGRPLPRLDPQYREFYEYCAGRSQVSQPARPVERRRPS